jgi:hypothetical protein
MRKTKELLEDPNIEAIEYSKDWQADRANWRYCCRIHVLYPNASEGETHVGHGRSTTTARSMAVKAMEA